MFQRGWCRLEAACAHAQDGLASGSIMVPRPELRIERSGVPMIDFSPTNQLDSYRKAKASAKRAMQDILTFLSHIDYTDDYPKQSLDEWAERVMIVNSKRKDTRQPEFKDPLQPCDVKPVSSLFKGASSSSRLLSSEEALQDQSSQRVINPHVTFHPLLVDALHILLMCHCIAQTSVKEIQRHAITVAKIMCLVGNAPFFSPYESAALADWCEILQQTEKLELGTPWEALYAKPGKGPFEAAKPRAAVSSANSPNLDKPDMGAKTDMGATPRSKIIACWLNEVPFVSLKVRRKRQASKGQSGDTNEDGEDSLEPGETA